jgi:hypothetical protein
VSELYLGSSLYDNKPYTRVVPKAIASNVGWSQPVDWTTTFPTEGKVFAPRRPNGFLAGAPFMFTVEAPAFLEHSRPDHWHLGEVYPAEEILDYRYMSAEEARRKLVEIGIKRSGVDQEERLYVALSENRCVELVLRPRPESTLWIADIDGLAELPVYDLTAESLIAARVDGQYFAVPGVTVGHQIGVLDWSLDSDFLIRVLNKLRKVATAGSFETNFPKTRAQVDSVVAALKRADLLPSGSSDLGPTRERLEHFSISLEKNLNEFKELVRTVAEMSDVRSRLAEFEASQRGEISVALRKSIEIEERARIEATSAEERVALELLIARHSALSNEMEDTTRALKTAQTEKAKIDGEILNLVSQINVLLMQDRNDISAGQLTQQLATLLDTHEFDPFLVADFAQPWSFQRSVAISEPVEEGDLEPRLREVARSYGFDGSEMVLADKIARAGEFIVMSPDVAGEFVECYSLAIAGSCYHRQYLDPSCIGLDDIWQSSASGVRTPFARAWQKAVSRPSRYQVVLIDGLDRTPMDLWVPGFVEAVRSHARPANLLVFGSLSRKAIDETRHLNDATSFLVPFRPTKSAALSGHSIARALGRQLASTFLVPQRRFEGQQVGVSDYLEALAPLASLDEKQRAIRLYGTFASAAHAVSLVNALSGRPSEGIFSPISDGLTWLNSLS